ncbi:hypothetical protein Btru_047311 [Bulinus truncatus]|nr:hypothetical protein Btru_047311 [Bulinus truncatus]
MAMLSKLLPTGGKAWLKLDWNEHIEYYDFTKVLDLRRHVALTLILPLSLNVTWMCAIFRGLWSPSSGERRLQTSSSRSKKGSSNGVAATPYSQVTVMLLAVTVTFTVLHTPSHAIRLQLLIDSVISEDLNRYLNTIRSQRWASELLLHQLLH